VAGPTTLKCGGWHRRRVDRVKQQVELMDKPAAAAPGLRERAGEEATLAIAFPGAARERLGRPPMTGCRRPSDSLACMQTKPHAFRPGLRC